MKIKSISIVCILLHFSPICENSFMHKVDFVCCIFSFTATSLQHLIEKQFKIVYKMVQCVDSINGKMSRKILNILFCMQTKQSFTHYGYEQKMSRFQLNCIKLNVIFYSIHVTISL